MWSCWILTLNCDRYWPGAVLDGRPLPTYHGRWSRQFDRLQMQRLLPIDVRAQVAAVGGKPAPMSQAESGPIAVPRTPRDVREADRKFFSDERCFQSPNGDDAADSQWALHSRTQARERRASCLCYRVCTPRIGHAGKIGPSNRVCAFALVIATRRILRLR